MIYPYISIIVPIYNVPETFLRQCIESLINQTLKDIEIILVDDGSLDDSGMICDEYAANDRRIKVIHKENGGLVSARNAGYRATTGAWHMYLDGDDWIDTDTCRQLMEYVSIHNDIDIVFWKCVQELGDKSINSKWDWVCQEKEREYSGDECHELARHTLIYKSGIATAYCKLIRTEYAEKKNIIHDDRLRQGAEGLEFSLRAFYHARKALYVNEYYNHYRYNPASISKQINEKNTEYLTSCFNVIEEDIEQFENKKNLTKALYQRVVYMLIAIAMSTYFHPDNKDCIIKKIRKYRKIIAGTPLYTTSIRKCDTNGMDKLRIIVLTILRLRLYAILQPIAGLKTYYLKRGKYDY